MRPRVPKPSVTLVANGRTLECLNTVKALSGWPRGDNTAVANPCRQEFF